MHSTAFLKPRIIDVQNMSPYHAKLTMEPFERGYGHTFGDTETFLRDSHDFYPCARVRTNVAGARRRP